MNMYDNSNNKKVILTDAEQRLDYHLSTIPPPPFKEGAISNHDAIEFLGYGYRPSPK